MFLHLSVCPQGGGAWSRGLVPGVPGPQGESGPRGGAQSGGCLVPGGGVPGPSGGLVWGEMLGPEGGVWSGGGPSMH